jgi:UDP-2,3-diacylglucosamine pyrophosphatase LpxH
MFSLNRILTVLFPPKRISNIKLQKMWILMVLTTWPFPSVRKCWRKLSCKRTRFCQIIRLPSFRARNSIQECLDTQTTSLILRIIYSILLRRKIILKNNIGFSNVITKRMEYAVTRLFKAWASSLLILGSTHEKNHINVHIKTAVQPSARWAIYKNTSKLMLG